MTYISETGRTLQKRLTEYKYSVKRGENGIAVHANSTFHEVDWEEATVLDEQQHWGRRRVMEAVHIKKRASRGTYMNLDLGLNLNPIWNPVLSD